MERFCVCRAGQGQARAERSSGKLAVACRGTAWRCYSSKPTEQPLKSSLESSTPAQLALPASSSLGPDASLLDTWSLRLHLCTVAVAGVPVYLACSAPGSCAESLSIATSRLTASATSRCPLLHPHHHHRHHHQNTPSHCITPLGALALAPPLPTPKALRAASDAAAQPNSSALAFSDPHKTSWWSVDPLNYLRHCIIALRLF